MAKVLLWRDLPESEILSILEDIDSPLDVRRHLQIYLKLEDNSESQSEILLDMYLSAFLFTQDHHFSLENTSALISIVKDVHTQAVGQCLTLERSWETTKHLLLMHSVQRPPFSVQIFSWTELQAITTYLLNTYYRHYKLYQYAFCPTLVLNLETEKDDIEIPPPIPSLNEAASQEQWDIEQETMQREKAEENARKMSEQVLAEEAGRQASIEAAYRDFVPEEIAQKTKEIVDFYLHQIKSELTGMLQEQERKLEEFSKLQSLLKRK